MNASQELDSGTWTCSLSNSVSGLSHEAQIQVQVFSRPSIKITLLQNVRKKEAPSETFDHVIDLDTGIWKVTKQVSRKLKGSLFLIVMAFVTLIVALALLCALELDLMRTHVE